MPLWTLKLTNKIEQGKPAFTPVKTTPAWQTQPKKSEIKSNQAQRSKRFRAFTGGTVPLAQSSARRYRPLHGEGAAPPGAPACPAPNPKARTSPYGAFLPVHGALPTQQSLADPTGCRARQGPHAIVDAARPPVIPLSIRLRILPSGKTIVRAWVWPKKSSGMRSVWLLPEDHVILEPGDST
jgi:hypothetical protein